MSDNGTGKAWIPVRRSPLADRAEITARRDAARLAEMRFASKYILRADADTVSAGVKKLTGLALPTKPLTTSSSKQAAWLWMGPDEWMMVLPQEENGGLPDKLRDALSGKHHQLVDVSDYYTIIELSGRRAREVLMKLTTLDVHPRAFAEGQVTGTNFGHATANLWLVNDDKNGPVFRLFVRWSFADYLWCLLAEAGREWGMPEQVPVSGERMVI